MEKEIRGKKKGVINKLVQGETIDEFNMHRAWLDEIDMPGGKIMERGKLHALPKPLK